MTVKKFSPSKWKYISLYMTNFTCFHQYRCFVYLSMKKKEENITKSYRDMIYT